MTPRYDVWESPDEGGWYAEFWDERTGKNIIGPDGKRLMTDIHPQRYQAVKDAKRIIRETDWTQCQLDA